MQANSVKNIVIIKNLPSNIVEEAIVILKSNKYAKKLQMIEKNNNKEKVLEIAKEKSEELKVKLEELADYAKEKATPVIEEKVEELRKSLIKVTKEITNKLEEKAPKKDSK